MSNFKFSLSRLLEMRDEAVKQCDIELQKARSICVKLNEMLATERDFYLSERDELNEKMRRAEIAAIGMYEGSLDTRKKRMIEILSSLRAARDDVDLAEQNLIQARRDQHVLENLRARRKSEFDLAEEEKERKFLDEQATMRYQRRLALDLKKGS